MNTIKVQVFIMTRNRPETIGRAINSVLNQTYSNIELIVSDNSTDNRTQQIISDNYDGRLIYIRRAPSFDSGIDHINKIHVEANAGYYMIFHDDDEMLPEMIEALMLRAEKYTNASAIGANAYRVQDGKKEKLFFDSKKDIIIKRPEDLVERYSRDIIAPFPSYLYKKDRRSIILNKRDGGKYADVASLATLCLNGYLVLCKEPLMRYYIHAGQDSQQADFLQYMKLVNYLKKICTDKYSLNRMRIKYIYSNMLQSPSARINSLSCKVLREYSFSNYYIKYIIKKIICSK